MLYWTVGNAAFFHRELSHGVLRAGDPQFEQCEAQEFEPAYRFMGAQLNQQSPLGIHGRLQRGNWPLWFWPHSNAWRIRHSLRQERRQAVWHEAIALRFHLNARKVLLSHYEKWHLCLMQAPIFRTQAESEAYELHEPPMGSKAALEDALLTWTRVFQPHTQVPPTPEEIAWMGDTSSRHCEWQAVCWDAPRRSLRGAFFLGANGRLVSLNARQALQKLQEMNHRAPKPLTRKTRRSGRRP